MVTIWPVMPFIQALAICVLLTTDFASARTIVQNGEAVAADPGTLNAFDYISPKTSGVYSFDEIQLSENILASLTQLKFSNISLFYFDRPNAKRNQAPDLPACKNFPGDEDYPTESEWEALNVLSDGALIKTVPLGSACYQGEHYDADKCEFLINNWNDSDTHMVDPTSVMSPLFQGATCEPANAAFGGSTCTLGGFPLYSINVTNVAQIQLAVNFARNTNVRLVVRNTGHDFLGKSTGEGALSIWTHNLRQIEVLHEYEAPGGRYTGPAMKLGAGVMVFELYEAAEREGYTAVGGECRTVGVVGGYSAGGGHSPVTPIHGLAADQVLSIDIVTPDGRFITADEIQNTDLFWAIRGGGAGTWGVVTSMTVKVHPKIVFSGMTWDIETAAHNISDETFWKAIMAYWNRYPEYSEAKAYGYGRASKVPTGGYAWRACPFLIPGMKLVDFKALVKPLLDEWEALGVDLNIEFFEHESFLSAWIQHFPVERMGNPYGRTGSRLIPRHNWDDPELKNATFAILRDMVEEGAFLVLYNINADMPENTAPSSVTPAWRDVMMFAIHGHHWDRNTTESEVAAINTNLTYVTGQRLKDISPGAGSYGNEGDVMDPEFAQTFFGENYERLLQIKKEVDPRSVFWVPTGVGSEEWYVEGQPSYVAKQNGRLCRR